MLAQRLEELSFAAIEAGGLREGRTLDFKRDPVGGRDEDKRDFLADVSAVANGARGESAALPRLGFGRSRHGAPPSDSSTFLERFGYPRSFSFDARWLRRGTVLMRRKMPQLVGLFSRVGGRTVGATIRMPWSS